MRGVEQGQCEAAVPKARLRALGASLWGPCPGCGLTPLPVTLHGAIIAFARLLEGKHLIYTWCLAGRDIYD